MKISIFGVTALLMFAQAAGTFQYESAYKCLKSLSTVTANAPAKFTADGKGIYPGLNGFFIFTPTASYFFPKAEMTKSGDSESLTKISLMLPEEQPFKIFHDSTAKSGEEFSFGTSNEFDRNVEAAAAPADQVTEFMQVALGLTLYKARSLLLTNKSVLSSSLESCRTVTWDFPVDLGNGTHSNFQTELGLIRDRLKPSVFTMEYWFPKKGTSAN